MESLRKAWGWFFQVPAGRRGALQIVAWWELRRIPYNLIVGAAGVLSLLLFSVAIEKSDVLRPGEDAVEPLALLAAPLLANVGYTAGWVAELTLRLLWRDAPERIGPALLKLGITFSLAVVLFPSVYWGGYWLLHAMGVL